ncbi:MAG: MBL fold metallo-hydrolase [Pseudomonadota bacterium]
MKRLRTLLWLLGLLFCAAVVVLVLLPQIQIRSVRPPLPEAVSLQATPVDAGPISVSYLNTSSQRAPGRALAHPAYLLEWADGRRFLIDAGMEAAAAEAFGLLLERMWDAQPQKFHGSVADQLGSELAQVRGIGFTHLHIDHVQGAGALCERQPALTVFQTTAQHSTHNRNTTEGAAVLRNCPNAQVLDGRTLTPVPGFPGLAMQTLGGHTPGSTLFAAAVGSRVYLFTGDITNSKAALLANQPKAWWYSYLAVPEDTARTAQLRERFAALDAQTPFSVVVAHDLPPPELGIEPFSAPSRKRAQ